MKQELDYRKSHLNKGHDYIYECKDSKRNADIIIWEEIEKKILQHIFSNIIQIKGNEDVLDFACGTGRIASFLEKLFNNIDGVDISDSMLNVAKKKTTKVRYIKGDITTTLKLDKKYDIITAFRFFRNAQDQLRIEVIKKLAENIKPGGYLIVNNHGNTFSYLGLVYFIRKILKLKHGKLLSNKHLINVCEKHGFIKIKSFSVHILPWGFYKHLPSKWIIPIDRFLSKIPFLNKLSINSIFVFKKVK